MYASQYFRPLRNLSTVRASTSTRHSVTGTAPMAARRVARMRAASASFQSCRMWRSTHASPARGSGSVSAQPCHGQPSTHKILGVLTVRRCMMTGAHCSQRSCPPQIRRARGGWLCRLRPSRASWPSGSPAQAGKFFKIPLIWWAVASLYQLLVPSSLALASSSQDMAL